MPVMKGLLAPQNTFLDTIANHFDGTRKYNLEKKFLWYSVVDVLDKKNHAKLDFNTLSRNTLLLVNSKQDLWTVHCLCQGEVL